MNSAKTMKQGVKMFLLDPGPWPYIDKYYKFVSQKEGSDTPSTEKSCCLYKKITKCLKSHCNRFHSLISSEFKKCLTDGTKTSRK